MLFTLNKDAALLESDAEEFFLQKKAIFEERTSEKLFVHELVELLNVLCVKVDGCLT